jgi:hypothetical protein
MNDIIIENFYYTRNKHDELNKDIVTVFRSIDKKPLYQFMTYKTGVILWLTIENDEWITCPTTGFGRVFYNCTKDKVYTVKDDEFIWTGPYKTCGNYMLMDGCMWSFPYETRLVDISNFPNYKYMNMEDHFTKPIHVPFYSEEYFYEFIASDGEINIRVIDNEGLYFNTIKLE